ncbi:MAG: protein-methionine-sulfoxide reductase catalytic subunit MsrP [Nitrospirota bacterium]
MLIQRAPDVKSSEITPRAAVMDRRAFLESAGRLALVGAAMGAVPGLLRPVSAFAGTKLDGVNPGPFGTDEARTSYANVTSYNNFYEFSTDKEEPAVLAKGFKPRPWTLMVDGEVARPAAYELSDFIKPYTLEERVYRHRCVEAWSMVIPWVGIPLRDVIARAQPTSKARYVAFTTLHDPARMPGQRRPVLDWPYVEGLRVDEAMHPLTILAVGLYGETLPNQNGAPLRLVVPWKYGFKGIKSIVKISFTQQQPPTTWSAMNPREYGFYANVNPTVDHPRWSQASERRIGEFRKRKTLLFNGYADQVANLYTGMNLATNF